MAPILVSNIMDTILLALIVILLAVVALELYMVLLRLAHRETGRDPVDNRRDVTASGQTINVNLGTQGVSSVDGAKTLIVPSPEVLAAEKERLSTEQAKKDAEEREREAEKRKMREAEEEREREAAERAARAAMRRQTPSGAYAVTCTECGMENSSYRSECFNCGKSL